MKNLLIKEFKLGINAQIIIYASLAILILVPSWPTAISLLYSITGIITLFPRALANRDIEYTVLLPIKKVDVVKGKTLFIMAIEIIIMIISIIGGIIRAIFYLPAEGEEAYFEAVKPCISYIGLGFLAFGIMNIILISMYYKNPYKKLTSPLLVSVGISTLVLTIGSLIIAAIPEIRTYDGINLLYQILITLFGIGIFIVLSVLGYKIGAKRFERIDL